MTDTTAVRSNGVKKTKKTIHKKTKKPSKRDHHHHHHRGFQRSKGSLSKQRTVDTSNDVDLKHTLHELRKLAGAHHRAAKSVQSASMTLLDRVGRLEQASDDLEVLLSQIRPPPRKRNRPSKKTKAAKAPVAEPASEDTDSDVIV